MSYQSSRFSSVIGYVPTSCCQLVGIVPTLISLKLRPPSRGFVSGKSTPQFTVWKTLTPDRGQPGLDRDHLLLRETSLRVFAVGNRAPVSRIITGPKSRGQVSELTRMARNP